MCAINLLLQMLLVYKNSSKRDDVTGEMFSLHILVGAYTIPDICEETTRHFQLFCILQYTQKTPHF